MYGCIDGRSLLEQRCNDEIHNKKPLENLYGGSDGLSVIGSHFVVQDARSEIQTFRRKFTEYEIHIKMKREVHYMRRGLTFYGLEMPQGQVNSMSMERTRSYT